MKIIYVIFPALLLFVACHAKKTTASDIGTPICIKKQIELFSKTECEKNPNVKEYTFQSKTVFVFDPGQCGADMSSEVLDKDCKSLGFLGGFTGNVNINGEDFSKALLVRTVWEK